MTQSTMQFTTAKTAGSGEDRVELPFTVDGEAMIAYLPTTSQAAMFYRLVSRTATFADRINGALEFLEQTVEKSAYQRLRARTLDPADPFDLDPGLTDILKWLTDEFKNRSAEARPANPVAAARQDAVKRATAARQPAKAPAKKAAAAKR